MSVGYIIIPIDKEQLQELNEYLAPFGQGIPTDTISRYPTASEIQHVLDEMPDYTKSYFITDKAWDVDVYETAFYDAERKYIGGKHTSIYSIDWALDEALPLHIYFHGGWEELNLEIVRCLTAFTGPLILLCDSDAVPLLVSSEKQLGELVSQWKKNHEKADEM